MPKLSGIRLYAIEGHFLNWISQEESATLLGMGLAEELYEHRGDRPKFIGIRKINPNPKASPGQVASTDSSISFRECLANASIGSRGAVARAQNKVAMWPLVGEPRYRAYSE